MKKNFCRFQNNYLRNQKYFIFLSESEQKRFSKTNRINYMCEILTVCVGPYFYWDSGQCDQMLRRKRIQFFAKIDKKTAK